MSASTGYMIVSFIADDIPAGGRYIINDASAWVDLQVTDNGADTVVMGELWDSGVVQVEATPPITTGTVHVAEWRHEGGVFYVRVDGGTWQSASAGDVLVLTERLRLGGLNPVWFDGKIFEAVCCITIPTTDQMNFLAANMREWVSGDYLDASKAAAYAVVRPDLDQASKVTAYAVLTSDQAEVSKAAAYAVLVPNAEMRSPKVTAYAVLRDPRFVDSSKVTAYAVLNTANADHVAGSKVTAYAVLVPIPLDSVLASLVAAEAITGGESNERVSLLVAEALTGGEANVRLSLASAEAITGAYSNIRLPLIAVEVFFRVPREPVVVEPVFPVASVPNSPFSSVGLQGIGWSVHKKPEFATEVAPHSSGQEIRAAFWEWPRWTFELTFEYLPDKPEEGKNDLRTMLNFFMARQGRYDAFVYRDPTDWEVLGQTIATADGVTLQFNIVRQLLTGGFIERVGQVDFSVLNTFPHTAVDVTDNEIVIANHKLTTGFGPVTLSNPGTLPSPITANERLWIIRVDDDTIKLATSRANAIAGTAIDIATQGAGTNTMALSIQVYLNGTPVAPADYTVTVNQLIFDSAPSDTLAITADFKYLFVCRFLEDMQDYENFVYKLWELKVCHFKSLIE
jgi:hypothetical protein